MLLLADWDLKAGGAKRRIELYSGDLSCLPPEHAVDLLVVSAFPNDYLPTPTSLIGALQRNGISVQDLSIDKETDLRSDFACWLSRPAGVRSFQRILCVESGWRGSPPEIADDLFRAIAPISLANVQTHSVAMPLIGTGDQGYDAGDMLESIVQAAVAWLRRGMPVDLLKIVAYSEEAAAAAKERFLRIRAADSKKAPAAPGWDVFLSYAHWDAVAAAHVERSLTAAQRGIRVFRDKPELKEGGSWLMQIAEALDTSTTVVALYTPAYWSSVPCKDELTAGYVRQVRENRRVLFPVYFETATMPTYFEGLQYIDCRDRDLEKLAGACGKLYEALPPRA